VGWAWAGAPAFWAPTCFLEILTGRVGSGCQGPGWWGCTGPARSGYPASDGSSSCPAEGRTGHRAPGRRGSAGWHLAREEGGGRSRECLRASPALGGRQTQLKSQLCHILSWVGLGKSVNLSEPLCKLGLSTHLTELTMRIKGIIHAQHAAERQAQCKGS